MANLADRIRGLIRDTVESEGVKLWDVRFVKEGADYFLRIYIDSDQGISIDDCVRVSHAVDPVLDEADPIEQSYCMEVCSPGIERELCRPEHFTAMNGKTITVRLYKASDGAKEVTGTLEGYDGGVTLCVDGENRYFDKSEIAKVRLADLKV